MCAAKAYYPLPTVVGFPAVWAGAGSHAPIIAHLWHRPQVLMWNLRTRGRPQIPARLRRRVEPPNVALQNQSQKKKKRILTSR